MVFRLEKKYRNFVLDIINTQSFVDYLNPNLASSFSTYIGESDPFNSNQYNFDVAQQDING